MNTPFAPSQFFDALTTVSRKMRTLFNQRVTAQGLTYPRARALFRLARHQPMTQSQLACELELQQATLVRLLDRMEEHNLIERRAAAGDRRIKHIVLTPHGEQQAEQVHRIAERMRLEVFQDIDPDRLTETLSLLEQIQQRIAKLEDTDGHER